MNKLRFCGTAGWRNKLSGTVYYEANIEDKDEVRYRLLKVFITQKQAEQYGKRVVDRFNRIYK